MLSAMGAEVRKQGLRVEILPGQSLLASDVEVPGDISSAAFFATAASLQEGSSVLLQNVGINPTRTGVLKALQSMGADIKVMERPSQSGEPVADIEVRKSSLRGIDLPSEWIPSMIDELPALMVAAACAEGVTRIRDAAELRVKESDRLAVMAAGLRTLGVKVKEYSDGIDIQGGCAIQGGEVDSHGDHRCAMSFLILGSQAMEKITVSGCEMIATSYPQFQDDFLQAGADIRKTDSSDSVPQ